MESSERKLPETPFNGVVISVGRLMDKPSISILIMSTDEVSEEPLVVVFWYNKAEYNLNDHLRPGHRVKVTGVQWWNEIVQAKSITVNPAEFGRSYIASQAAALEAKDGPGRQPAGGDHE